MNKSNIKHLSHALYSSSDVKDWAGGLTSTQLDLLRLLEQSPYLCAYSTSADLPRRLARLNIAQIEKLTRRRFLIGSGALALGVALAGCEAVDETGALVSGATRTVEHAFGTTEVPVDPQRIAVVGRRGVLAVVLDLGFEPIAALDGSFVYGQPFHPLITDRAEEIGIEPIGRTDAGPNLEQVVALNPDLIIGASVDFEQIASQLAQIAPTVGVEFDFVDPAANVQTVAEVLGVGDEATDRLEEFWAEVDTVAANLPDPGTISLVLPSLEVMRIYRGNSFVGQLVKDLGGQIVPTEKALPPDPEERFYNIVSLEQVDLLSGDRLIFYVNLAEEAQAAYREFLAQPLVQRLPAVQAGQVLAIDIQLVFGAAGLTGMREVLSQLETFFSS